MSIETTTAHESAVTTEQDSFSQTLESYTSLVNGLLAESDVTDDEDMATIRDVSSQLVDDAREIEEGVKANEESVTETRELVADTRREQADVRGDVHEVKEALDADETDDEPDVDATNPTPDGPQTGTHEPVTPLERVTRMDEPTAGSSLSRNQDRARSVFKDVLDYTQSVPKGRAIATPDLRRVLTAFKNGGTACYKTVSRVVDFLTEMGKGDVWTKERMNGDTVVVFSEDICKRRAAYQNQASAGDSVVSGDRVAD